MKSTITGVCARHGDGKHMLKALINLTGISVFMVENRGVECDVCCDGMKKL